MKPNIKIIAEAAQGYEGSPLLAALLAKAAIHGEADAVKFQLVLADELATPDYVHYPLFQSLAMQDQEWRNIAALIHAAGLELYFDVFGLQSLQKALDLQADGIKLHTTDFANDELISASLEKVEKVLIGFGGVTCEEFESFLDRHSIYNRRGVTFLYGFQAEPTETADNHLARLRTIIEQFPDLHFGFMDHSSPEGLEAYWLSPCAIHCGATMVEKHITLEPCLKLEDSVSALAPEDFKKFAKACRAAGDAVGLPEWIPTKKELTYREKVSKVVVAERNLASGIFLAREDIALKRPGALPASGGIPSLSLVVGKQLLRPVQKNQPLTLEDIQ